MLKPGDTIGGRYTLIDKLGEGGMGTVWVARNTTLGDAEVALKVLHPNLADDKKSVERFRSEAQIAARIGHPNIVRVFDFGESDDGAPYMVMERLEGESLGQLLEREGSIAPREAASLMCVVLEALAAAHAKDVLHRDLKPENLFLAEAAGKRTPKILDFGVSKILGDDARRTRMTRTGAIVGTPAYMSPEQVMGTQVDLRSDLWAIGVILYELITGRLPFDGPNYNAVLVHIATTEHEPILNHVPTLDPVLVSIIDRALARKPSARFASAEQMREALHDWLSGATSMAPPTVQRAATHPQRQTPLAFEQSDTLPGSTLSLRTRSSSLRWIVMGAAATVILAGAMIVRNPFARSATSTALMPPDTITVRRHMLRIDGLPRGAHIVIDDDPAMLPAPLTADGDHRVRVSAPGYRDWMQVVPRPSGDVALAYTGERLPEVTADVPTVVQHATRDTEREVRRTTLPRRNARRVPQTVHDLAGGAF